MSRRKLIAANWKMNKTLDEARAFADELSSSLGDTPDCDMLIIPPFFAVPAVAAALENAPVDVGAQDLYWEPSGAYTGEVSGAMIVDAGGGYALVGHSERRHVMGENNDVVRRKLVAALESGLVPILCVGETLEEREAGDAEAVVVEQLGTAFDGLDAEDVKITVVAYEPVWAIGTGRTATPDDAETMHRVIRRQVAKEYGDDTAANLRILYGGSVKPENAADLLSRDQIDGALVGGASLQVVSYLGIAAGVPAR